MTHAVVRYMTPWLAFSCFCLLLGDMSYGYDTNSFGGILANPGFINQFGVANAKGVYAIPKGRQSLLSSLAFVGKLVGTAFAAPLIERLGHRKVFGIFAFFCYLGVIVEITAAGTGSGSGRWVQFIIGRIFVYVSIGLIEIVVTTYQSEIVPSSLRGFVIASLQLFLNSGALIGTGVNRALRLETDGRGWKIVTGIQFVFPTLLCLCAPFVPHSPRWLLSKDRDEDAIASLRRVRTKEDIATGRCEEEIVAIRQALQSHVHKKPWKTLIQGTNLRRTIIVIIIYQYGQTTGQAFSSTYSTTFYKNYGFANQAFLYPVITAALSVLCVLPGMFLVESVGRRFVLMLSFAGQGIFLCLLAGLGTRAHPTTASKNTMVASFILFSQFYNFGVAPVPYIIGAEVPNGAVREKTDSLGASINVVFAFVVNFVIPYLLAAIGVKTGWLFAGISFSGFVYTFLFLPETKGLALEEIDSLFEQPFNPFKKTRIVPNAAARRVGELEGEYSGVDAQEDREKGALKQNSEREMA